MLTVGSFTQQFCYYRFAKFDKLKLVYKWLCCYKLVKY